MKLNYYQAKELQKIYLQLQIKDIENEKKTKTKQLIKD